MRLLHHRNTNLVQPLQGCPSWSCGGAAKAYLTFPSFCSGVASTPWHIGGCCAGNEPSIRVHVQSPDCPCHTQGCPPGLPPAAEPQGWRA
ncbi:unnamed protein product [Linum tenue]|uniref:Uncharacterized protein n=1 Tax=Linum tenue TaxID=586396 RepID=A0AAV0HTK5_9ROSI|nr:unnamed protein product [Linum tenue]